MTDSQHQSPADKALAKIAELIVERITALKGQNWEKTWFPASYQGLPRNLSGRPYNGMNTLILDFATCVKGHDVPVFLTFNQAKKEGLHIAKGAKSVPILYYDFILKDEKGKTISPEAYEQMGLAARQQVTRIPLLKKFDVFNVADTNLREIKPEVYETLKQEFAAQSITDTKGMYANPALDRMIDKQEWLCPIHPQLGDDAYYHPAKDFIVLPLKAQFRKGNTSEAVHRSGMEFYATAMHEMAHSTGVPQRLNREKGKMFGDAKYAKEELVAELTAATLGRQLGFDKKVTDNNAKYLSNWLGALKKEPKFVLTILGDVGKAAGMIMKEIEKQRLSLEQASAAPAVIITDAKLVKHRNGTFSARGKADGKDTGLIPMDKQTAAQYFKLSSAEKTAFLSAYIDAHYSPHGHSHAQKSTRKL